MKSKEEGKEQKSINTRYHGSGEEEDVVKTEAFMIEKDTQEEKV